MRGRKEQIMDNVSANGTRQTVNFPPQTARQTDLCLIIGDFLDYSAVKPQLGI